MRYFNYCQGLTMTNRPFPPAVRRPAAAAGIATRAAAHGPGRQHPGRHRGGHAAASAGTCTAQTGMKNLVLAGGVALNCVANGRLLREGPFDDIWIQPAAGDAGGALGRGPVRLASAARQAATADGRRHAAGQLARAAVLPTTRSQRFLDAGRSAVPQHFADESELLRRTWPTCWPRRRWSAGSRAGWSSARGPWAPAASSATPARRQMQATMNLKIKFRESFRPFAPVRAARARPRMVRDASRGQESPYMLLVAPVRDEHRVADRAEQTRIMHDDPDLRHRVNVRPLRRSRPSRTSITAPACRRWTPSATRGSTACCRRSTPATGCPVLVNTSFNVRGEPIVCTPQDAYRCFLATDMDALVLERSRPAQGRDEPRPIGRPRAVPGPVPTRLRDD